MNNACVCLSEGVTFDPNRTHIHPIWPLQQSPGARRGRERRFLTKVNAPERSESLCGPLLVWLTKQPVWCSDNKQQKRQGSEMNALGAERSANLATASQSVGVIDSGQPKLPG